MAGNDRSAPRDHDSTGDDTGSPRSENHKTDPQGNAAKDPEDWVTGDEPMTGAQASYLRTLCEETDEEFDPDLTKAQASERIDALRARDPRLQG